MSKAKQKILKEFWDGLVKEMRVSNQRLKSDIVRIPVYALNERLSQSLDTIEKEMGKVLRMKKRFPTKEPKREKPNVSDFLTTGYNQAVKKQNQKIDNYLKEGEK